MEHSSPVDVKTAETMAEKLVEMCVNVEIVASVVKLV